MIAICNDQTKQTIGLLINCHLMQDSTHIWKQILHHGALIDLDLVKSVSQGVQSERRENKREK